MRRATKRSLEYSTNVGRTSTHGRWRLTPYLWAAVAVAASGVVAVLLHRLLALPNISLVFLFAVLFTAIRWGLGPSILASALSVLVVDFFLLEPHYTFVIASPQDVLSLVVFVIVSVLTSNLAGRVRAQSEAARTREARTAALYDVSQRIAGELDLASIATTIVEQVARMVHADTVLVIENKGSQSPIAGAVVSEGGTIARLGDVELVEIGQGWRRFPLSRAGRQVGYLAISERGDGLVADPDEWRLVEALADLAAVGVERAFLSREIERATLLGERERLQSLLLSSISHDLRTPLASIIGAATSLIDGGENYSATVRSELAETIRDEGERLNRFVGNLLDTTRIDAGALRLNPEWVELGDVVGAAARALAPRLAGRRLSIVIDPSLPMLRVDFVLIEQVFVNILENAVRFSPEGATIGVAAKRLGASIVVEIEDMGPGIPEADLERVFDKFYRVDKSDRQSAGTGLGLSICRGIVHEHGGSIHAESPARDGAGTRIVVTLPVSEAMPDMVDVEVGR